jgi:uncharacterized protein YwgA
METNDFVPLALLAMGSEIQGKTKLQKTVYFLGLMTGCLDELGYRPHFYGPYSDEVAGAIDRLYTIGAVDRRSSSVGSVDRAGFEVRRIDFSLNADGKRFVESKAQRHPELWKAISAAATRLKQAGDIDYAKMSIAAKTYFMLHQSGGQPHDSDLARLAARFGWEVTLEEVKEAVAYLRRLGLLPAPHQA